MRIVLLTLVAGLLLGTTGRSEDKPKEKAGKKPVGVWTREVNNHTLTFTIRAEDATILVKNADGNTITVEAAYGVTRDSLLFAVMTKVTKKGIDGGPDRGDLFSFTFSANDRELTISDLKGTQINEEARKLVEGVYKKK